MTGVMAGKVAVITGGSAGIGRAAVELFAREGAQVVLAARSAKRGEDLAEKLRAEGHQVLFVQADVSQSAEVQRMVSRAVESSGASIAPSTTPQLWDQFGARQSIPRPNSTSRFPQT